MSIIDGVVVIDLRTDVAMTEEEVQALNFLPLKVMASGMTGQEVYQAIKNFTVPSEIEEGDYKDYAVEAANNTLMLVEAVEGAEVLEFSDSPRNWAVVYSYEGAEYRIGVEWI